MKLALCQMLVSMEKKENIKKAMDMIAQAAGNGCDMVVLPEMFNCPYSNKYFRDYGETAEGETVKELSQAAKMHNIYLVGGSIPELSEGNVYNTSFSFNRNGEMIGRHRKVHLFDINVEGGISFQESETLTPGKDMTILETEFGKIGIAICYDVRFAEWSRKMALAGAKLIILPAAFNMTTGPAHWDLTMRMRALDNQVFFAAASPARDMNGIYQAYGNSCVANPWGEFVVHGDETECILYGQLDFSQVEKVRKELPILNHRRTDLYGVNP